MKKFGISLILLLSAGAARAGFRSSDQGVLLSVGRTAGSFGSSWVTDLTIWNSGIFPAIVDLVFLPTGGQDNRSALTSVVEVGPVAPGASLVLPDVFVNQFGVPSALGAILYFGSRADAPAVFAPLIVQARVFDASATAPGAASGGSFGAVEPGSPYYDEAGAAGLSVGADEHVLTGLEEDDDFRTNVGVWNGSDPSTSVVVEVDFLDSSGLSVGSVQASLPPLAHLQWNGVLASLGARGKGFSARARLLSSSSSDPGSRPFFFAYGSVTNNRSNDPSYIEPAFAGEEPVDCIFK